MREFRTSGSVGAPGGQSPGATRPFFLLWFIQSVEVTICLVMGVRIVSSMVTSDLSDVLPPHAMGR